MKMRSVVSIRPAGMAGLRILLTLVVVSAQAGCANFKAVSAFADHTAGLTGTVRTEFSQLDKLCVDLAELEIVDPLES